MSIASELTALQGDITNARNAITTKGGTVTSSGGSSQLATDIATIPTGGGDAITVPISMSKNLDIDFSEHELYAGFTGDGVLGTNRHIHTGITISAGYHYNIEFKFRKDSHSAKDENFISCFGNDYRKFRVGMASTGYIFCRGWNRTNLRSPNAISLNEDHVVKIQYNSGTVSMYVDDVFQASNSVSETMEGGELIFGTFAQNSSTTSSIYSGTLYYIKMTDATNNNSVVLDWDKTIASENSKPIIIINSANSTNIQELPYHALYGATGKYIDGANPIKVNAEKWGGTFSDFFNTSVPADVTLSDIVIPDGEFNRQLAFVFRYSNIKSFTSYGQSYVSNSGYVYQYMLSGCPHLEDIKINKTSAVQSINTYTFNNLASNCPSLKHFYCNLFSTATTTGGFAYLVNNCDALKDVVIENFSNISGTNIFSYAFSYCQNLTKVRIVGGGTCTIFNGSGYSGGFNNAFKNSNSLYDENINRLQFPNLTQIGYNSGTTTYGALKYAFTTDTSAYYGKLHLILPELKYIYNRNTITTNGHFSYNTALGKIYLPKFVADGTTGKNIFTNCSYLTEIHFGIENQATIEALAGYSSKFGATNATLYFDMPNHITVGGTVYDRNGLNYDYDTSHYSWINGSNIIYTANAINPAVGDAVYTKSGDTYTASGTITAVS